MRNNKTVCEIHASTLRLYRKTSQAVAIAKHSEMPNPSNGSAAQAHEELVHIKPELHRIGGNCTSTKRDNNQLFYTRSHSF